MLWIEVLCVIAAACSGALALWSWSRARRVEQALRSAGRLPQSFDSRLNALTERQDAMEALLQKIDARDRMRRVRAARDGDGDNAPDPWKDPSGWKDRMRAQRAKGNA